MITEKAYRSQVKTKKTVQAIDKALKSNNIKFEEIDYVLFLFNKTAHFTVLTDNCTIEVYRDQITVNEQSVSGIDAMIYEIQKIES